MQTNFGYGDDASQWDGVFEIIRCKKALSPSGIPGIDYALNPYSGCEHGCVYCYAPEITHKPWEDWRVVKVKIDVADRLVKELPGLTGRIGVGTVTDPYQGAERRFRLTEKCLQVLSKKGFPVTVHTKSPLVLRDIGLLKGMDARVRITLTGIDRRSSLITEPGAPLPAERLEAVKALVDEGIRTTVHIEPVLDHVAGTEEAFADAVAGTGVGEVFVGGLNGRPELSARLRRMNMGGSDAVTRALMDALRERGIAVYGEI